VATILFPRTKDRLAASAGFWALTYGAVSFGLPAGTQFYIYGAAGVTVFLGMVFAWWQGPPQSPRTLQLVEGVMTLVGVIVTVCVTLLSSLLLLFSWRLHTTLWHALPVLTKMPHQKHARTRARTHTHTHIHIQPPPPSTRVLPGMLHQTVASLISSAACFTLPGLFSSWW
jgi:hypothetical protein